MKVLHVLNSRIYSGAEKVVCQIIHSFSDDPNVQMVYCSPDSDIVRQMLCEQSVIFLPVSKLTPRELKRIIEQEKQYFDSVLAKLKAGFDSRPRYAGQFRCFSVLWWDSTDFPYS